MHDAVSITALSIGQIAEISQIVGPPERVRRFEELGLRAGARLEMVQPGSPCIVRVDSAKICFRSDELSSIIVKPRKTA